MDRFTLRIRLIATSAVVLLVLASGGWGTGFPRVAVVEAGGVASAGAPAAGALVPARLGAAQVTPTPTSGGVNAPGTDTVLLPGTQPGQVPGTQPGQVTSTGTVLVPGEQPSPLLRMQTHPVPGTQPSPVTGPRGPAGLSVPGTAASTQLQDQYLTGVDQQYRYYNGPDFAYPQQWYAQRHLAHRHLYTMYPTEPVGICSTYYYRYQNAYYCYIGN